ncbi:MAG: CBS domain-containing protein [Cytophagales bacterium]|nr:CBS domain-containing protein [Cytophagales bacterium]
MIAEELINQMIPPLKLSDTVQKVLNWMEEFRIDHLPVIENQQYLGLVSEETILQSSKTDVPISTFRFEYQDIYVQQYQHFYDVIKIAIDNKIPIIAVLDEFNKFLGVITVKDTVSAFAGMSAIQSPGGIIVLSLKEIDYSLSEISRLVESNDAKILSSYISTDELDISKLKLTLKLNKVDLSPIIATFERFNYNIIAKFQETELVSDDKERLDLLLKYLSM